MTHGIEAAREVAAGAPLSDVSGLLATEALIGLAYAAVAYGLFRLFELEGRRHGTLETYCSGSARLGSCHAPSTRSRRTSESCAGWRTSAALECSKSAPAKAG